MNSERNSNGNKQGKGLWLGVVIVGVLLYFLWNFISEKIIQPLMCVLVDNFNTLLVVILVIVVVEILYLIFSKNN